MALAHDDIWQKFDLFGERGASVQPVGLLDSLADCITETDTVPDISDLLFDVGMDCDGLAGLDFSSEPVLVPASSSQKVSSRIASLPLIDCETETLRHDCMWSGHCPSEEHRASQQQPGQVQQQAAVMVREEGVSSKSGGEQLVATPTWLLDTPSTSDLESGLDTSDLDETLSDCEEVEEEGGGGAMQAVSSNPAMSDHCYSGSSLTLLTPAQSSEDEDSGKESVSTSDTSFFIRPSICLIQQRKRERQTIRTRPPLQTQQQQQGLSSGSGGAAKFKFQVKFTGGTASKPRSLLRHPARLTKTLYSKRRSTIGRSLGKGSGSTRAQSTLLTPSSTGGAGVKTKRAPSIVEEKGGRDIRDLHNSMERQRRVDLKRSFDALKERIPSISAEDKVSKLMILNTASEYCRGLLRRETSLTTEREREKRRNTLMKKKLTLLRTQHKTSLSKCTTRRNLL